MVFYFQQLQNIWNNVFLKGTWIAEGTAIMHFLFQTIEVPTTSTIGKRGLKIVIDDEQLVRIVASERCGATVGAVTAGSAVAAAVPKQEKCQLLLLQERAV